MVEVATSVFKAKCLALLEQVRCTHQPIRVTRHGKPVAEVIPPSPVVDRASLMGSMKDLIEIKGDIIAPANDADEWEVLRDSSSFWTHIGIWFLGDTKRLGRNVYQSLRDAKNELWVSPISTWEALTLHHKGRIYLHGDLAAWVARATTGMREAVLRSCCIT
jgi:prevent-host-death family protein